MSEGKFLGEGSYGSVKVEGDNAVKTLTKITHTIQEAASLIYLADTNYCVHLHKVDLYHKKIYMQLYDNSLRKYLEEEPTLNTEKRMKILSDICKGLIELHDRRLCHGDLKPGNVLIRKNPLKAVLGDCGFVSIANYAKNDRTAASYREMKVEGTTSHDIYSFGICFYEIITRSRVKHQVSYKEITHKINRSNLSSEHKKFVLTMVQEDKEKRPSSREILKQLFDEEYPVWKFSIETLGKQELPPNLPKERCKKIKERIRELSHKYKIERPGKCYGLLLFVLPKEKISEAEDELYIRSVLLIFSSLFSTRTRFSEIDALKDLNVKKKELCKIIQKIINNPLYMKIIMAPSALSS